MKKVACLTVIVGVVFLFGMGKPAVPSLTEEQISVVKEAVLKKHAEIIKHAENLDVDKFFESIIDGGLGTIIQDGKVLTHQEALDSTRKGFEGITKLKYEFSHKSIKVLSPEIAILTAQGKSIITTDTEETFSIDFAVTSVFVLKDGQWKIIHGHNSVPNTRP